MVRVRLARKQSNEQDNVLRSDLFRVLKGTRTEQMAWKFFEGKFS